MSQRDQATAQNEDPFASLSKAYQELLAQIHQTTGDEGKQKEKPHTEVTRGFCVPAEWNGVQGVLAFIPLGQELHLSPQQLKVAGLVLAGLKSWEIAKELNLSESTVLSHLKHMYFENGVHSRVGLLQKAFFSESQRMPDGSPTHPSEAREGSSHGGKAPNE